MNIIDLHIHVTINNLQEIIDQIVAACSAGKKPVIKVSTGDKPKDTITVKTHHRKPRVLKLAKDNSEPKSKIVSQKTCVECGKSFKPHSNRQAKCDECRGIAPNTDNHTSDQDKKEEWAGHTYQHTCRSCGRIFFTEMPETDRDLCNENCKPPTVEQIEKQQQIIDSGEMFADLSKEKRITLKTKNTNGKRKENNRN